MIENIRTHPYKSAVCLETARLFEHRAAKHLVEAQDWADQGVANSALEFQTKVMGAFSIVGDRYGGRRAISDEFLSWPISASDRMLAGAVRGNAASQSCAS